MKKNLFLVLISLVGIIIFCFFMFVITGAFAILMPEPPKPSIIYGEFPFRFVYEVDGETKVYEDVIICEYAGVESRGTAGKYRKWNSKLKSGNKRATLLKVTESDISYEIYDSYVGPEYFMGDFRQSRKAYDSIINDDRYLGFIEWKNGEQKGYSITKEEAFEKYKIRVIAREFSEPIKNSFE